MCAGCSYSCQCVLYLLLRHSPIARRLLKCESDDLGEYASDCVLRNKMICAVRLDYGEEEVRRLDLILSTWSDCAQRRDTGQDSLSQIWMQ